MRPLAKESTRAISSNTWGNNCLTAPCTRRQYEKFVVSEQVEKTMPEGYEHQIVYGMAFYGKKAMVKLMK